MKQGTSFWDRRRAGVQAETDAERRVEQEALAARQDAELAEKDDAEILLEMGLPDPAAMQKGDDFAAFMAREVPERIRKKALRSLWRSNPVLACVDGLNDYDDDYAAGSTGNGPIKTAYQVGKGMMYHLEEMARQSAVQDGAAETGESEADEEEDAAEILIAADEVHLADETPEQVGEAGEATGDQFAEVENPAPRRMRFHFPEARA